MSKLIIRAVAVLIIACATSVAAAQDARWEGCYRDPYTGEYVCERGRATYVPRQPVCYPYYANQCWYDAWGNYRCVQVAQQRCR
jgi:hypothetical protein